MRDSDLICHFSFLDRVLILRPQGSNGNIEIIGRAVLVTRFPECELERQQLGALEAPPPLSFYHDFSADFEEERIYVMLDIIGLQSLTRSLNWRKML